MREGGYYNLFIVRSIFRKAISLHSRSEDNIFDADIIFLHTPVYTDLDTA
jgi:hypothetical protein